MTDKLLQCCYTNESHEINGKVSSGWQSVAVSKGLPSDALENCKRIQNENSTIQGPMEDEDGNVLNLFEIVGDGNYLYVIRTQYGLQDRLGRANMFSHAFIFSCRDGNVLSDPNDFLTISNDNFKTSTDEAISHYNSISYLPQFNIDSAVKVCGLSMETYSTLIKCVYSVAVDKHMAHPLFIQYDGSETHMRNLLYCIYSALPFNIRGHLSVASAYLKNKQRVHLVFCKKIDDKNPYIVPTTGKNNLLSTRADRRLTRLGFVDFVAKNYNKIDINAYYKNLEQTAHDLGETSTANELVFKIAHLMLRDDAKETVEDSELEYRLSDALRIKSYGSSRMDKYIARLLSEATKREMSLTEESEENLALRLEHSKSEDLVVAAENYNMFHIVNLPIDSAANKLAKLPYDIFQKYRSKLLQTKTGTAILDCFYAHYLDKIDPNFEVLLEVVENTRDITQKPLTVEKIEISAWNRYISFLSGDADDDAVNAYSMFIDIMANLNGGQHTNSQSTAAKKAFWDAFNLNNLSLKDKEKYELLKLSENPKSQLSLVYCNAVSQRKTDKAFFLSLRAFYIYFSKQFGNEVCTKLICMICEQISENSPSLQANPHIESWFLLFALSPTDDSLDLLFSIYDGFLNKIDEHSLSSKYRELSMVLKDNNCDYLHDVSSLLIQVLSELDTSQKPVSLDTWLAISECVYNNSFDVFDTISASILECDPKAVASGSSLLCDPSVQAQAEEYIKGKKPASRKVKSWLSEYKYMRKHSSSVAAFGQLSNRNDFYEHRKTLFSVNGKHNRGQNKEEVESRPDRPKKKRLFGKD